IDDLHRSPAKHIGRADKDRISDVACNLRRFRSGNRSFAERLWNPELPKGLFELVPVFRAVEVFKRRAEDIYAACLKGIRQVDGRLSAKLYDDALWLLEIDDRHDIFDRKRLKVELVGNGEVGRYRFRIVVDDDRLVTGFLDGPDRVDRGIVELDALPDADRTGAKDNDAFLAGF